MLVRERQEVQALPQDGERQHPARDREPHPSVPPEIPRPPYAESGRAVRRAEDPVQSPDVIERMRRAGRAAAEVLALTGAAIRPGITTDELDAICHQACIDRGGYPSPLNYNGFPKSLCTSVNEVICHGIPDDRPLRRRRHLQPRRHDLPRRRARRHQRHVPRGRRRRREPPAGRRSRASASSAPSRWWRPACPSTRSAGPSRSTPRPTASAWSAASSATGSASSSTPTSTCRTTTSRGSTACIEEGMTFTIEPMITMGAWEHDLWDDGWTAVTVDRRRTAQFEHTLVVTASGCDVLTCRSRGAPPLGRPTGWAAATPPLRPAALAHRAERPARSPRRSTTTSSRPRNAAISVEALDQRDRGPCRRPTSVRRRRRAPGVGSTGGRP